MKPTDLERQRYRDMLEEPDKYSDQEIEAMIKDLDRQPDVEEAWQQFNARSHSALFTFRPSFHKAAAILTGILMMSGIAIAAIHIVRQEQQATPKPQESATPTSTQPAAVSPHVEEPDTVAPSHLYDNVPLGEILSDLSTYYNIYVVYRTEDAQKLRLYYRWKHEYSLDKVIEMLNNFEWLQIELENDTLYVKSTATPAPDC